MTCEKHSDLFNHFFSLLLNVSFIFCFLIVFYFLYVHKVENDSYLNQMSEVADSFYEDLEPFLKNILKTKDKTTRKNFRVLFKQKLNTLMTKIDNNNKKAHSEIDTYNYYLRDQSITWAVCILTVMCIVGIVAKGMGYCIPIWLISVEGLILLGFVALTEYVFLVAIGNQYKAVDPNLVKNNIAKKISLYADKKIKNKNDTYYKDEYTF